MGNAVDLVAVGVDTFQLFTAIINGNKPDVSDELGDVAGDLAGFLNPIPGLGGAIDAAVSNKVTSFFDGFL